MSDTTVPKVSVIIPCYNSEKYIGHCLQSVINQTYQNWEAIVVVSPSNDRTFEIAYGFKDPRITIFQDSDRWGVAAARNTGFSMSSGSYVTFLDADDWFEPQRCEKMIQVMDSHPLISYASHGVFFHKEGVTKECLLPLLHPYSVINFGAVIFRRLALQLVIRNRGYLFENTLLEDGELSFYLQQISEPYLHLPVPYSHYSQHEGGVVKTAGEVRMWIALTKLYAKYKAFNLLPFAIKNLCIGIFNQIFNCNIVLIWKRIKGEPT